MDRFYLRYCGRYLGVYALASLVISGIAYATGWNAPSSLNLVIAFTTAFYPGALFVKDNGRLPEKIEKRKFTAVSLLIISVFSCLLLALLCALVPGLWAALTVEMGGLPVWALPGIIALSLLLYYALIGWGFSNGAKTQFKVIEKGKA